MKEGGLPRDHICEKDHLPPWGDQPPRFDEQWKTLWTEVTFIVIDDSNFYNTILGHTPLHLNKIVASMFFQMMKFPTPHGILEVKGVNP